MPLAIALVIIVVASVVFNFLRPWWFTPAASNWGEIDNTINLTLLITGVVFVVINLFLAYLIVRYRYRKRHRSDFEPENKPLENKLILLTTIGIVVMLAPGLFVYSDYVTPPEDAAIVEVVGQQWQWSFRFPGVDGVLGVSSARYISSTNPLGISPKDPRGRDDIIVLSSELHLPIDQPVKMLLRSKDTLHDFYVPQIRAKMDLVPGTVSSFWFTPTVIGRYEILCAELCGVGHYNMRGLLHIDSQSNFDSWYASLPTFASSQSAATSSENQTTMKPEELIEYGAKLSQRKGCLACHSVDGNRGVGPSWKNLYGSKETLADGRQVLVDDVYLTEAIQQPNTSIVKDYPPIMPPGGLSPEELSAVIAYIKALSKAAQLQQPLNKEK